MIMGNNNNYADNGSSINDVDINLNIFPMSDPFIPLELPPTARAQYFTGRGEQLTKLLSDLQPRKVVTLCGAGGMGKTALAAEAVYTLIGENNKPPKDFPDGVVFHSFYGNPSVESAMIEIAVSFGVEIKGFSAQQAVKKALNGKTALIVLDGAENADNLPVILSLMGGCGVLITTRDKQDAPAGRQDMQPLSIEDAVSLLGKWAENQVNNKEVATQICEQVGGLPLAVRLVGRYLSETNDSASSYLEWLEENMFEALDPDDSEHRHESVKVLLARSVVQLNEAGRQMLPIFGCLAMKPVWLPVLAAALKFSQGKSKKAIKSLINLGLIQGNNDQYEVTHALIHTYAREEMPLSAQIFKCLAGWYEKFARTETEKGLEGYYILDNQQAHILYLIKYASQQQQWQTVIDLVGAVDDYLDIRGYWQEQKQVLLLALVATQTAGQYYHEVVALNQLGLVFRRLGDIENAINYHQRGLIMAKKIKSKKSEGAILGNLGLIYTNLGELDKAINFYRQALSISRKRGDLQGQGIHLGNLGIAYKNLGALDKAIYYHRQALIISRKIKNKQGIGQDLGNLGNVYKYLGELNKAIDYHQQALAINKEIGDLRGQEANLGNLGVVYKNLGKSDKAIGYHQQALVISRKIGNQQGQGIHLGNLGLIYIELGKLNKAIDYHQQALDISRQVGDQLGEGTDLNNLGEAYKSLGQFKIAHDCFQQALVIWEEINSPHVETAIDNLKNLDQSITDSKE